MNTSISGTVIAAALTVAMSTTAWAVTTSGQDVRPGKQVVVEYADLNLDREAGVQALYQRITAAAERVCGAVDVRDPLASQRVARTCFASAVEDAVRTIDHPNLNRIHRS